jgi:hypothetical protein
LVIERDRLPDELDGLRYYTDPANEEVLFQTWFYCTDLGKQLKPVIEAFFSSEAYHTGRPTVDSVQAAPFEDDIDCNVGDPQNLDQLLDGIGEASEAPLFSKGELKVVARKGLDFSATDRNVEVSYHTV